MRRKARIEPSVGTATVLRETRLRLVLLTPCSALLCAGGVAGIASGAQSVWAWGAAIGFGLGTVLFAWFLTWGARTLSLDERGFAATLGFPGRGPVRAAWRDVTRFSVVHAGTETLVGFHLRPGAPPQSSPLARMLNHAVVADAPDGCLPTLYAGMSAADTVKYLQRWHDYAAAQRGPAEPAVPAAGP